MRAAAIQFARRAPAAFAGALALFALLKMEGRSAATPIWIVLVLLSAFVPVRLPNRAAFAWLVRILLIAFVVGTNLSRTLDMVNVFDSQTMTWFGELWGAELALVSWIDLKDDAGYARRLWISALILFAASCTPDDTILTLIAPAYFLCVLTAIRWRARSDTDSEIPRLRAPWRHAIGLAAALLCGAGLSALLSAQKGNITQWGMQLLGERRFNEAGSLSFNPSLGSTFGDRGSMTRALLIEGDGDLSHLRGIAFDTYVRGQWSHTGSLRGSLGESITNELEPTRPGPNVRVTRLLTNHAAVFAPINCNGLHFDNTSTVTRIRSQGDLIRQNLRAPAQYEITLGSSEDYQGPLCVPPTAREEERLLAVPPEIDPRVRALAAQIVTGIDDPRKRVRAVERYLLNNNKYSMRVDIGLGDPLSNFLLQHKAAHCEYFASADVILSRLAGVPARYVIGYLGHEEEEPHKTVVRQRDAHAWAECWIDGTGWVVSDATPGGGRPDALSDRPWPFTRFIERLQDIATGIRLRSGRTILLIAAGVSSAVIGLIAIIRAAAGYLRSRRGKQRDFRYAVGDEELAAIFTEFETACRKVDIVCPSERTWSERLAAAAIDEASAAKIGPDQLSAAQAFVSHYNRLRFGAVRPPAEITELRALLVKIQSKAS